ncbi:MAG TPA: muramoyltetrapeptide carboxypeptidase [Rhodanobacteraceae bacterium]|nr:muramoyltetrapeptide carboxypeptidase [Rhodanobacteraceae bacterium]
MSDSLRIQLIAPSGWPAAESLTRGVARLRQAGHQVTNEDAAKRRYLRFAGTDPERAADINMLADPDQALPDIVMAVRGGYGVHRILDRLDYPGLRKRLTGKPFALVGHSDITALNLALLAKAELITFAGPMLAYDFGGQTTSGFTLEQFWGTLRSSAHVVRWQGSPQQTPVNVMGPLWGGNLAVLCSLLGTPYMPDIRRGILFVEDVFEPTYRIERLLCQLKLSGVLDRQRALVLGDFSGYRADEYDPAYDMRAVVAYIRSITDVPVVTHLPFGHCRNKLTLPVGARARLRVDADGKAELAFAGYPHLAAETASVAQDA